MALPTGCVELYHSQRRVRTREGSLNKVTVQQLFECLPVNTDAAEVAFMSSSEGLRATPGTKLSVAVTPRGGKTPGTDLITVAFDYWDFSAFPIGSATVTSVSSKVILKAEERMSTPGANGTVLSFGDAPGLDGHIYKIIAGAFDIYHCETVFSINTGIPRADYSPGMLAAVAGQLNASTFMGMAPHTLMILGGAVPKELVVDQRSQVIPVSYILGFRPEGWPTTITYRRYKDIVEYKPVEKYVNGVRVGYYKKDETYADTITGSTMMRAVHERIPDPYDAGDTAPDAADMTVDAISSNSGTFSFLQGLVSWWTYN